MKLPKMKLSVVLAAGLLLAACGSENSCAIPPQQVSAVLQIFAAYLGLGGGQFQSPIDILPASMSDSAALKVWVAEAQSNGPLSTFTLSNGGASTAMPVDILPGVHAGGITSWIGPTPQQSALYEWTNANNATIEVLDDQDGSFITSIPLGTQGVIQDFAVAPDGKLGYATVMGSNKLYVVDLSKNSVKTSVVLGTSTSVPFASAVDPTSDKIYVTDRSNGFLYAVDATGLTVTSMSVSPNQQVTLGKPAVTPDGTQLFIPVNQYGLLGIDLGSNAVARVAAVALSANELAFSPDGTSTYLLVSPKSGNGSIISLNTATFTKNWSAPTGVSPHGLFLSPQGTYLAVANSGDGTITVINSSGALVSTTDVGMTPVGVEINH